MKTVTVHMSSKYQVVIPKAVREALELGPDTPLLFLIEGHMVILRPKPASFAEALRGLHKELWLEPEAWLEKERATWE
jgi:AbrB family looped-hinge helix DNA binding protein